MEHAPNHQNYGHSGKRRTLVMVAAALGLGIVFDILFFGKLPGISFPLFIVLALATILAVVHLHGQKAPRTALFMIPLLLFFSSMVYVRANEMLTFFNVVISLYLLGLFITLTLRPWLRAYSVVDYLRVMLDVPLLSMGRAIDTVKTWIAGRNFIAKHKQLPQVIRGVLIALPVLLVFLALFASADLVFREYVSHLFNFQINGELFWRTVMALVVALVSLGAFVLLGERRQKDTLSENTPTKPNKFGLVETSILFGSLNVLFLSFILVQLAYLFGGAQNVVGGEFTYAEYARKGFFELIAVAGFSLLLLFVTERLLLRQRQMHDLKFKLLSSLLIVQVLVIMVSAVKRLHLYESAYGFTSLRLISYIFMAWLAAVFVVFLYKILADRRENELAFALFVSVMALFAVVNFMNIDALVASKNIDRYERTGKLDVRYLEGLSDDGVVQFARLLDAEDQKLRNDVANTLYYRRQSLQSKDGAWQSANVTRKAALRVLDSRSGLLEENKDTFSDPAYRGPGQD